MSPKEQKKLTRDIAQNAIDHIERMIDNGRIPESWDGIELRWYLCENITLILTDKKIKRKYNNTIMVNGL